MARFKEPAQLHNHSKYSLLDAVPSPEEWVGWCLETGTPALAVTDHGTAISMYDALKTKDFIKAYNENKLTDLDKKWFDARGVEPHMATKDQKKQARAVSE